MLRNSLLAAFVVPALLVVPGVSAKQVTTELRGITSDGLLAGAVIVVDPGHQLGNTRHPQEISRLVDAGGFLKPCNTTGTATNGGYPEATFAFAVAQKVRHRLVALGATVIMSRYRNSYDLWGPCVDYRGKLGNRGFHGRLRNADLKLSIHADGSSTFNHGFHVIVAKHLAWRQASTSLAITTRSALQNAGFRRSTYAGGGTAIVHRGDLGTLNWSHMPSVMVELGNMRNSADAATMTSDLGRTRYARALVAAARTFLHAQMARVVTRAA